MCSSLSTSSSATDWIGIPVQREMTSSTSPRVDVEDLVALVLVALLDLLVLPAQRDLFVVEGHRLVEVLAGQGALHARPRRAAARARPA